MRHLGLALLMPAARSNMSTPERPDINRERQENLRLVGPGGRPAGGLDVRWLLGAHATVYVVGTSDGSL